MFVCVINGCIGVEICCAEVFVIRARAGGEERPFEVGKVPLASLPQPQ